MDYKALFEIEIDFSINKFNSIIDAPLMYLTLPDAHKNFSTSSKIEC